MCALSIVVSAAMHVKTTNTPDVSVRICSNRPSTFYLLLGNSCASAEELCALSFDSTTRFGMLPMPYCTQQRVGILHDPLIHVLLQVLHSDVGQQQPFYFFLQPSYWRPSQMGKGTYPEEDPESPLMSSSGDNRLVNDLCSNSKHFLYCHGRSLASYNTKSQR